MHAFQSSTDRAGTAKCPLALSIPTTSPFKLRITTVPNMSWASPIDSSSRDGENMSPVSSGINAGATMMKITDSAPSPPTITIASADASS